MKTEPFEAEHLRAFPGEPLLAGMEGFTVKDGERVIACGGHIRCPWGPELWICVKEDVPYRERLALARAAKDYVSGLIEKHGEVWTSASRVQRRWLGWLGFRREDPVILPSGERVGRWRAWA